MSNLSRRHFLRATAATTALACLGLPVARAADKAVGKARVVIIGGGFGGATAAKYLKLGNPEIQVTLVERNQAYYACPGSNDVIAGIHPMRQIERRYNALANKYGIQVVHASASQIDPEAKQVMLDDNKQLAYDRLIVSPGVDIQWGALEGYDEDAAQIMPHAWRAGPQTLLLQKQLQAMPDGGLVLIACPGNPYRCPPGPYERASLIAHYLKQHKPKSKIRLLDSKTRFSKQALFMRGWEDLYPGMVEWVSAADDGKVMDVDVDNKLLITEFDEVTADVMNVIPPQQAGRIAHTAGLTDDSGWCPVDQRTFESTLHPHIHVIGDASIAGAMPKSGYAANTQAKVCAAAVLDSLAGRDISEPSFLNTCYSFIGPEYGISVAAVYAYSAEQKAIVSTSAGVTPMEANRGLEAIYAASWHKNIAADVFG